MFSGISLTVKKMNSNKRLQSVPRDAEYVSSPNAEIGFIAVVNLDVKDREQFENDLKTAIAQAKICCFATIYFEENAEVVRSLTSEGVSSYIFEKSYCNVFSFEMENCTEFSEAMWSD